MAAIALLRPFSSIVAFRLSQAVLQQEFSYFQEKLTIVRGCLRKMFSEHVCGSMFLNGLSVSIQETLVIFCENYPPLQYKISYYIDGHKK